MSLSVLTEYLTGKRLLLVLDNCEHLLDGCAVLASTLIKACPDVRVLATSRQALGVAGEVRMLVPPMSLPDAGDETSMGRLSRCDAVWLLSERAAAVVPGFAVDAGNAEAGLGLCRRFDGIPLALELAAVRLGSLSLDQLNKGVATELSILGTGNSGAEYRQQTLEATIGWSYGLLNDEERGLWARLSVFAGGFDLEPAPPVLPAGRQDRGPQANALHVVAMRGMKRRPLTQSAIEPGRQRHPPLYTKMCARLGVDSHLQALRHYSATELLTADVDLRTVADRLGHSGGGATTLRVYAA